MTPHDHLIPGSDRPVNPRRRKNSRNQSPQIHPPVPGKFTLGIGTSNPLISLQAATVYLGCGRNEILKLVEDGRLRWAFDISGVEANRREARIARESLFEFVGFQTAPPRESENEEDELLQLIERMVPEKKLEHRAAMTVREVARSLGCTYCHVRNLLNEGSLALAPEVAQPYHAKLVSRDSFVDFLRERRMS
jgi:hypothetical protein